MIRPVEELARRVEAATGPDRGLDAAIAEAFGVGSWYAPGNRTWGFTASLDAAMTLVPESADSAGERFRLEAYNSPGVLAPHVRASAWVAGAPRVYAATPALALTAAALLAHASLSTPMKGMGDE